MCVGGGGGRVGAYIRGHLKSLKSHVVFLFKGRWVSNWGPYKWLGRSL